MLTRGMLVVVVALLCSACSAGATEPDADGADAGGSAVLVVGDETHEFRVLEHCLLPDDGAGRVQVKAVGEADGDALRLEVVRQPSPVVDDATVDAITVTRGDVPWVSQAIPTTTQQPTALFDVDGVDVAGEGIEFRRADVPGQSFTGSVRVTCP